MEERKGVSYCEAKRNRDISNGMSIQRVKLRTLAFGALGIYENKNVQNGGVQRGG